MPYLVDSNLVIDHLVSLSREIVRVKSSAKMSVASPLVGVTRNEVDGWAKSKLASRRRVKPCFASPGLRGLTHLLSQLRWPLSHQPDSVLDSEPPERPT